MAAPWKSLSLGDKILRSHNLLWWAVVYPSVVIVLGYTSVASVRRAQAILNDHSIAQAVIAVDEETPPTNQLARFKYSFDVNGTTYSRSYPVPWSRADQIEVGSTIPIAYANFDPSQSQREELLATNADMKASLTSLATLCALGFLLIGMFWLLFNWLLKRQLKLLLK